MQNNYVGDIAISLMPNLVLTLENASSVGARPVLSYQLFWAGPWIQHPVAQVAEATSNPQALQSGQQVYAANCAVCHGATGNGGVGPNLHQVATTKTFAQTVAFIENPTGGMPKLYPSKLTDQQVRDVATYVRTTFK
jgi:mono/diheme cytochrome c family protein